MSIKVLSVSAQARKARRSPLAMAFWILACSLPSSHSGAYKLGVVMEEPNTLFGLNPGLVGWIGAMLVLAIWNHLRGK